MAAALILTVCLLLGKLFHFFYSPMLITSASMEPDYPVNSLVFIKDQPFESLSAGDVIAYKSAALGGGLALHRITRVTEHGVYTKGDNNRFEDNQLITRETYVGKGVFKIVFLADYLSAVRKPAGFLLFFLLPVLTIFLSGIWITALRKQRIKECI